MGKHYSHLSSEERAVLHIEVSSGASIRSIASCVSRSAFTLSRELTRQEQPGNVAWLAGQRYQMHRKLSVRKRKIVEGCALFQSIRDDLVLYRWSPQQINKLRGMHRDDPSQRVSHETIHTAIYVHLHSGLKKELVDALRRHKPMHCRRCAGRVHAADEDTASLSAWQPGQRLRQRNDVLQRAHAPPEHRSLVRQSTCALSTRQQLEHRWAAAPVDAQGC